MLSFSRLYGYLHRKRASGTGPAVDGYVALVRLDERLHHREPKAGAFDSGGLLRAVVPVEYVRQVFVEYSRAGVRYRYLQQVGPVAPGDLPAADGYVPAFRRVLYRVRYEVCHHARHLLAVRVHVREPAFQHERQPDALLAGLGVEVGYGARDELARVHLLYLHGEHAGLQLRQAQVLLHHVQESPAVSLYGLDEFLLLGRERCLLPAQYEVRKPDYAGERRLEVVRDERDQVRLPLLKELFRGDVAEHLELAYDPVILVQHQRAVYLVAPAGDLHLQHLAAVGSQLLVYLARAA